MSELVCGACVGKGYVIGWDGAQESMSLGGFYPREVMEPCEDCGGTGLACCTRCGGTPEVEDLGDGQLWCTTCWVEERDCRRTRPAVVSCPSGEVDDDGLPF